MSIADTLLKQLQPLSWYQRAELLEKIARDYGDGFARVMREEIDKRDRKQKES